MKAFYRGYHAATGRRSTRVTRLHIMRPDERTGLCGINGTAVTHSPPVVIDPVPATPPPDLTWCPHCLGRAAEALGLIPEFGARVAAEATATPNRNTQPQQETRHTCP